MFKEFIVKDVLNVEQTKSVVAKADLTEGDIPYVTRTVSDNGYMGTCGNKDKVNKGNCITIGAETGVAFYQPNDFVAGNKVYRLSREGLDIKEYLFLASVLNMQTKNYSYSNARIPEKIKAEKILLPVIENPNPDHEYTVDDIDWQYMRDRITELERDRITELDAYLQATGLNDYELTKDEKRILSLSAKRASDEDGTLEDNSEDEVKFSEFRVGDLFAIEGVKQAKSQKDIPTDDNGVPYVVQSQSNNMVARFVNRQYLIDNDEPLCNGNCIVLGVTLPAVSYQKDEFGASQVITARADFLNENIGIYFAMLFAKLSEQFTYQNKPGIQKYKDMSIYLPITSNGTPDFDYMERYIRAMEKVVIADVVKYKDKVIETTRSIV